MKKNFKAFACGVLACLLIAGLCGTAIAATTNIPVSYGIKVLFDGQSFQPKDGAGRDVQLFSYNGTVYAPIRAVCEKAGLRVDYDGATNTASVMSSGYEPPAQTTQEPAAQQPQQTAASLEGITFTGNTGFLQLDMWKGDGGAQLAARLTETFGAGCTVDCVYYSADSWTGERYGTAVYFLSARRPDDQWFTFVISADAAKGGILDELSDSQH